MGEIDRFDTFCCRPCESTADSHRCFRARAGRAAAWNTARSLCRNDRQSSPVISRANLAWYCSHHHNSAGENAPSSYSYLFAHVIYPPAPKSLRWRATKKSAFWPYPWPMKIREWNRRSRCTMLPSPPWVPLILLFRHRPQACPPSLVSWYSFHEDDALYTVLNAHLKKAKRTPDW